MPSFCTAFLLFFSDRLCLPPLPPPMPPSSPSSAVQQRAQQCEQNQGCVCGVCAACIVVSTVAHAAVASNPCLPVACSLHIHSSSRPYNPAAQLIFLVLQGLANAVIATTPTVVEGRGRWTARGIGVNPTQGEGGSMNGNGVESRPYSLDGKWLPLVCAPSTLHPLPHRLPFKLASSAGSHPRHQALVPPHRC